MGNTQYSTPTPPKLHLTPPRIFLLRNNYGIMGNIKAGQIAQELFSEFFAPSSKTLFGTTVLLSESPSEGTFMECDANIQVDKTTSGRSPVNVIPSGGVRFGNQIGMCSGNISPTSIDLGGQAPIPGTPVSLFSRFVVSRGKSPELFVGANYKYKPETTTLEKVEETVHQVRANPRQALTPSGFGSVSPVWKSTEAIEPPSPLDRNTQISLYAKLAGTSRLVGTEVNLKSNSFFGELICEADADTKRIQRSDAAVSWILDSSTKNEFTKAKQPGSMEISLAMRNFSSMFDSQPIEQMKAMPKLTFSFYKHLVIPRKVFMAIDERYKLISNYVDFGFVLDVNPKKFLEETTQATEHMPPMDVKLVGSWQLNKSNMFKAKIGPEEIAAAYVLKTWWKPRVCASITATFNYITMTPGYGVWVVIDTVDKLEREKAVSYKESVGYSVVHYVEEDDEEMV